MRRISFCPERKGERRKTRRRGRRGSSQLEEGQAGSAPFTCPPHPVCSLLHTPPHTSLTPPPGSSASASHWVRPVGNPDRKSESGRRVFTLPAPFLFLPKVPGALGGVPSWWLHIQSCFFLPSSAIPAHCHAGMTSLQRGRDLGTGCSCLRLVWNHHKESVREEMSCPLNSCLETLTLNEMVIGGRTFRR